MKDFWGMRMLVRLPLDSSHMIFIRSVIRKIGVTRLLSRLFPADNNSYEQRFQEEMKQRVAANPGKEKASQRAGFLDARRDHRTGWHRCPD